MLTPPAKQGKLGCEAAGAKPKSLGSGKDKRRGQELERLKPLLFLFAVLARCLKSIRSRMRGQGLFSLGAQLMAQIGDARVALILLLPFPSSGGTYEHTKDVCGL